METHFGAKPDICCFGANCRCHSGGKHELPKSKSEHLSNFVDATKAFDSISLGNDVAHTGNTASMAKKQMKDFPYVTDMYTPKLFPIDTASLSRPYVDPLSGTEIPVSRDESYSQVIAGLSYVAPIYGQPQQQQPMVTNSPGTAGKFTSPPPSYGSLSPWSSPRTSPSNSSTSLTGNRASPLMNHNQPRWRPQCETLNEGLSTYTQPLMSAVPAWQPPYTRLDECNHDNANSDTSSKASSKKYRRRLGSCSSSESGSTGLPRSLSTGDGSRPGSAGPGSRPGSSCGTTSGNGSPGLSRSRQRGGDSKSHPFQRSRSMTRAKDSLQVGQKSQHNVQSPGCFSHPSKMDLFPNGDIAILDTGNHTLQIFMPVGVCKKLYTFADVLDIAVWDANTVLLLKRNEIGIFRLLEHRVNGISLPKNAVPLSIKKLASVGRKRSEDLILVILEDELLFVQINGKLARTIPVNTRELQKKFSSKVVRKSQNVSMATHGVLVDSVNKSIILVNAIRSMMYFLGYDGQVKSTIDMARQHDSGSIGSGRSGSSSDSVPHLSVHPGHGCCLDQMGNLILADPGHNQILVWLGSRAWVPLIQYSRDYLPLDVRITDDNRLTVIMDSIGRSFAGFRIYNYDSILRDALTRDTDDSTVSNVEYV